MGDAAHSYLTTREVADLLRLKERKVYDLVAEGDIPCVRVTGKLLFPRDLIEAGSHGTWNTNPASRALARGHRSAAAVMILCWIGPCERRRPASLCRLAAVSMG